MIAGLDYIAIIQAGGSKTFDVVARYVENAAVQNLHQRRWATLPNKPAYEECTSSVTSTRLKSSAASRSA